jgi:tRNA(Ile)-lysidine synthase
LDVLEQFLNHIARHKLCNLSDSILLAISGGIDSMAMLHLFKEAGYRIGVAHCNFQLRGEESNKDELLVVEECKRLAIPFYIKKFDTETFAWEQGVSIQMAARDLRYVWFEDLVKTHAYNFLATGHHFDDSMETILLNLTKGTSIEGFAGIPLKNKNIIRPLLFATRAQVTQYATEKGVRWREDESNFTDDYQRNFIRHHVIPKLKELNPSLESTWQNGLEKIEGDLELLHLGFNDWKRESVLESEDRIVIAKKSLRNFYAGASALWRYIKGFAFNFEQAREIIHAINGQSGKRFLSPTHILIVDREELIITPHSQEWSAARIENGDREVPLGPWRMFFSTGESPTIGADKMEAALDADSLKFPLTWRKWKKGDAFQPLGMKHKKKLSDFLVDNKISIADKNITTVLESAGEIVYVVGWRIDDRFKIQESTKRVLNIRVAKV